MSTSEPTSPNEWQAFRYVEGEMSADERIAFEGELAQCPVLCELVAETQLLVDAIRAAESVQSVTLPVHQAGGSRRFFGAPLWYVSGTLVALVVAAVALLDSPFDGQNVTVSEPQPVAPAVDLQVLTAWSDLTPTEVAEPVVEEETSETLLASVEVPDWMLAAVQTSAPPEAQPQDMRPERTESQEAGSL